MAAVVVVIVADADTDANVDVVVVACCCRLCCLCSTATPPPARTGYYLYSCSRRLLMARQPHHGIWQTNASFGGQHNMCTNMTNEHAVCVALRTSYPPNSTCFASSGRVSIVSLEAVAAVNLVP